MKLWYVVHTQARGKAKASHHLLRQGFLVYFPQYLKVRRHVRKSDWVKVPLFARYLFVSVDVVKDSWYGIQSTIGVNHLIYNGEMPVPISDEGINDIRSREDENRLIRLHKLTNFRPGDSVQILGGAFHDEMGFLIV